MSHDSWAGLLDEGETILWQGRPDGSVTFTIANLMTSLFGLAFAGFALFWMIMASQAGGFFWMFGLIHFCVGCGLAAGPLFWDAFRRRHTWYTLTNQRAFIATNLPFKGKSLDSYPMTADTPLSLMDGPPATVYFAAGLRRGRNGKRHHTKIGFERIEEGREVFRMMRDIQSGDMPRGNRKGS
ncbi:MAG: aspartate carbamoyltransferase catalytic subunit [Rhodobacteraceae bacterium]|nr:aspartate carbamoyltransferase catalytic subunit [Paracoccaceae bacterium]MCW9042463.1 aspartate carbamoyltransferase catalytic subunit [Pseudopelagicola sp.]